MVPHLFFHISLQGLPPIYLIINFCLFYPGASLRPSLLLHLPSSCPNLGPYQLIPHLDPKVIILKSNNIDHFTHLLKLLHWQVHVSWSTQNLSAPRPWLPLQSSHCSRRVSPTLHEPMCLCIYVLTASDALYSKCLHNLEIIPNSHFSWVASILSLRLSPCVLL